MDSDSIFPEEITDWRCPACGKRVTGNYGLDEGREKCAKKWHKATRKKQTYARADLVEAARNEGFREGCDAKRET